MRVSLTNPFKRSSDCRHAIRCLVAIVLGIGLGIIAGWLTLLVRFRTVGAPARRDFDWALVTAADVLAGRDPYAFTPSPLFIPYPLPVIVFGIPLVCLPSYLAAAVFFGGSTALLVGGCILRGEAHRLAVLLSFPYFAALFFTQWSPLIMAAALFPLLGPLLVLVKPQIALPVAVGWISPTGGVIASVVLGGTLLIDPTWPLRWSAMLGPYEYVIPALVLPCGPLLLLATLRLRASTARLLLTMALLPVRAVYDLCPLWLLTRSLRSSLLLALVSWAGLFLPSGVGPLFAWWAIPLLYLPMLVLVLREH